MYLIDITEYKRTKAIIACTKPPHIDRIM